jgi:hypothetical protein
MTAVCSLLNPLDPTGDDGLLAFYNDNHMNLGFTTQNPQDNGRLDVTVAGPKPPKFTEGTARDEYEEQSLEVLGGEPTGLIRNPSQIAAFRFQNLIRVYGITDADSTISLLSPGLQQTQYQTDTSIGSLGGCSDGGNAAWIYYLKSNPQTIMELDLAVNNATMLLSSSILQNTTLAAFWDPVGSQRVLVYQSTKSTIMLYFPIQGTSSEATGTDVAATNTPIAACSHPSKSRYYVYFLINSKTDFRIRRIVWDRGWSGVSIIGNAAPPASQYTNIFVTPQLGVNHLFYVIGNGNLYHFKDIVDA